MKSCLLGGILGGLLVFAWGSVSWMVLDWHDATLKKFSNEDVVAVTLQTYAPEPGVYLYPNAAGGETAEEKQALMDEAHRKMAEGPIIFAAVQGPSQGMGMAMALGLASTILSALLITWLVLQGRLESFARRYAMVLVFAVAASLVGIAPNWIWWGFATDYTLVALADVVIGWGLGGLVIAWAAAPENSTP